MGKPSQSVLPERCLAQYVLWRKSSCFALWWP